MSQLGVIAIIGSFRNLSDDATECTIPISLYRVYFESKARKLPFQIYYLRVIINSGITHLLSSIQRTSGIYLYSAYQWQ